jgi:hypothetical protein
MPQSTIRAALFVVVVAAVLFVGVPNVLAHEVTWKGTVASFDAPKPDEKAITVDVADPAGTITATVFYADPQTEIFRGEVKVAFAQATFAEGEPITVMVNLDLDEQYAIVIRLEPAR